MLKAARERDLDTVDGLEMLIGQGIVAADQQAPEVGSALVSLRLPGMKSETQISNEEEFLKFVKTCFAQKRKTLVNNLRGISEPEATKRALEALGAAPSARAEELSVEQMSRFFEAITSGS